MSQIIRDLSKVADPGPGNSYLLSPVVRRLKQKLGTTTPNAEIERLIRASCEVTSSPSGLVLVGWYLKRSQAV